MIEIHEELLRDIRGIIRKYSKNSAALPIMKYIISNYKPKIYPQKQARKLNCLAPEKVIELVTEHFKISLEQIKNGGRKKEIVYAKHVCMYLLLFKSRLSLKSVANIFGGMDHTSVMSARNQIKDLMDVYPEIKEEIEFLKSQL